MSRYISRTYHIMSSSADVLSRLQQRASEADQIISQLKHQLQLARQTAVTQACIAEQQKLAVENAELRREVERLKNELVSAEVKHGVNQILVPNQKASQSVAMETKNAEVATGPSKPAVVAAPAKVAQQSSAQHPSSMKTKDTPKAAKAEKKPAVAKPADSSVEPTPSGGGETVDVSRLNMRIGRIVDVKKHPDADSLYVEEVDVGEPKNRTIVSGLVKHVPLEQMQNRIAVFLLNLKPAKMRGVSSEGMIMCASSPEKVEIIVPPPGVVIGDRVTVEGYAGSPDEQLNPKKKTWEQIQPELRINSEGVATYKGARWLVEGKDGLFKAPTMVDSAIR